MSKTHKQHRDLVPATPEMWFRFQMDRQTEEEDENLIRRALRESGSEFLREDENG